MKDINYEGTLRRIAMQFEGIALDELSKLERNILGISFRALGYSRGDEVKVNDKGEIVASMILTGMGGEELHEVSIFKTTSKGKGNEATR